MLYEHPNPVKVHKRKKLERKDLSFAFIDLRKAFDSVRHVSLIETLAKKGLPRKTLVLIADMYTGNSTTLQDGNIVNLKRGVLQGDPLLPLLFNLMIDEALESIDNQGTVLFEGIALSHIAFADDLVILANDAEQLNQKIQILNKNMNRLGMSVNS